MAHAHMTRHYTDVVSDEDKRAAKAIDRRNSHLGSAAIVGLSTCPNSRFDSSIFRVHSRKWSCGRVRKLHTTIKAVMATRYAPLDSARVRQPNVPLAPTRRAGSGNRLSVVA